MKTDHAFEEARRKQRVETLQRLRDGMDKIADAVLRLNDLGRPLGVPPVFIRFSKSASPFGDVHYANHVSDMLFEQDEQVAA
ncbi:MAG TPA: hypothetical protein VK149_12500 [Sideroxyarcus sp.]|nr:hypothetical protein [Sideroxyarcus sp.]